MPTCELFCKSFLFLVGDGSEVQGKNRGSVAI